MKRKGLKAFLLLLLLIIFSCFLARINRESFSDNSEELLDEIKDASNNTSYLKKKGLYKRQIPMGEEDLYILKSQIVPPVCPAYPDYSSCSSKEPPPPCPACARCPEPSFECKKVPNYRSSNNSGLPVPVLNSFSTFGM